MRVAESYRSYARDHRCIQDMHSVSKTPRCLRGATRHVISSPSCENHMLLRRGATVRSYRRISHPDQPFKAVQLHFVIARMGVVALVLQSFTSREPPHLMKDGICLVAKSTCIRPRHMRWSMSSRGINNHICWDVLCCQGPNSRTSEFLKGNSACRRARRSTRDALRR